MLKHSRHNSQDSRYSSARHGFEAGDQMPSSTHAHGEAPLRTRGKGFAHAIENVTRTNSFALVVFIILVVGLVGVGIHAALFPKDAVAKDGISFAFVRVGNRGLTTGKLSQDEYFEYNAKAADQAGLKVGAYFFS